MKKVKKLKRWLKNHNKCKHYLFNYVSNLEKTNESQIHYDETLKGVREIIKFNDIDTQVSKFV